MKKILELAVMDGVKIEVKGDRIVLTINEEKTKRDLWKNQIEFWLEDATGKQIESGYLRIENNNKLKLSKNK